MQTKLDIRRSIRQTPAWPDGATRDSLSAQINAQLNTLVKQLNVRAIASFYPFPKEPDIIPFLETAHQDNIKIGITRVAALPDRIMQFGLWEPNCQMIRGNFSNFEPESELCIIPDCVLVAGLAFDRKGNRMGRGFGYYDATLEELRKETPAMPVIGVCYEFQVFDNIPLDGWDQPMTHLVTEDKIYDFKASD